MSLAYDGKPQKNPSVPMSSHFRRILAQVRHFFNDMIFDFVDSFFFFFMSNIFQFLATTVKNLILFDIGLQVTISGIIIPALTGLQNAHNRNETLSLTASQASWLGNKIFVVHCNCIV